jgi:hypothetical protein
LKKFWVSREGREAKRRQKSFPFAAFASFARTMPPPKRGQTGGGNGRADGFGRSGCRKNGLFFSGRRIWNPIKGGFSMVSAFRHGGFNVHGWFLNRAKRLENNPIYNSPK